MAWPPRPLLVGGTMTQPPSLERERAVIVPTAKWSELRACLRANWRTTMEKRHKPEEIVVPAACLCTRYDTRTSR